MSGKGGGRARAPRSGEIPQHGHRRDAAADERAAQVGDDPAELRLEVGNLDQHRDEALEGRLEGGLRVDGRKVAINSPRDALRPNIALGLLPEDRKTEALFVKLTGKHNVSLPVIERLSRAGLIEGRRETDAVASVFDRVEVDRRALWTRVGAFSGGNQQKIALAKWLFAESAKRLYNLA